ncbi:MAG: hypothetical protein M3Z00_08435 [Actinomycetota bacterium]|nr:hypothetical protein [Actinomycetota bacterium]
MPVFGTPEPIWLTIDIPVGDIRLTASDREDTVVEVAPSDSAKVEDRLQAEQTRVEYGDGRLLVKAPRQRGLGLFSKPGSVDVTVSLPTESRVECDAAVAAVHGAGRFGACRVKSATGDIRFDEVGTADLHTAAGSILIDLTAGDAELTSGSGKLRVSRIDGSATIKNSNGDCWVGEISGTLRMSSGNGTVVVDRPAGDVTLASGNGDVRVGDLTSGVASAKTGMGRIEIGIHAGTAALLDLHTSFGTVRNSLESTDGPHGAAETVELHARTSYGDIVIRRA